MIRQGRLKRRVAHALRRFTRGTVGRRTKSADTMRELVALAWPIMTAMVGETVMGLVDTKLVGGLGAQALGGVGVALTIAFLGYMIIFGLMRGVKVCVAHAVGEGRGHRSARYAQAGIVLGLLAGTVFTLVTRDTTALFRAIGIDAPLVPYASAFLSAYTLGAPASSVVSALVQHRQAEGDSRTPMVVGLTGNVVNALLGWALIYGHAGLPALGVRGGAYATATSEWIEAFVLVALLVRDVRRRGDWAKTRADLPLSGALREAVGLGLPTGIQFGSEMLAFATFTAVLGSLGAAQIAAHQIAMATIRTSFLPGAAVAEAASVLVGQALGRRSLASADRATRAGLVVAIAFMAACGAVFAVAGGLIVRLFTDDPAVARVARLLLLIAAAFQVVDAMSIVLRGALRGAKDVRVPAIIGVAVVWTCVPTAALLLGRMAGWGSAGGWLGFLGETTLGAVLFLRRWKRGAWRVAYGDGTRAPQA
jgi:MATE family multidrug resistance protein